MAKKTRASAPLPPHRARGPRLVPADQPFAGVPTPHGLVALLFGPASGVCAACDEPTDRLAADGRLCLDCVEPWDEPRRAS